MAVMPRALLAAALAAAIVIAGLIVWGVFRALADTIEWLTRR